MDEPTVGGDVVGGALCIAGALIGHFVLVPLGVYVPESVAGTLDSPAVMPLIMFTALGLFGALLLVNGMRASAITDTGRKRSPADWRRAFGMVGICAGYLALIVLIGLPIASGIGLAAALWYFGERKLSLMVPLCIVVPAVLWLFFVHVVHVSMPPAVIELGQLHEPAPPVVGRQTA